MHFSSLKLSSPNFEYSHLPPQELERALNRCGDLVASCATMGPLFALMHDEQISAEFVSCTEDVGLALKKASE